MSTEERLAATVAVLEKVHDYFSEKIRAYGLGDRPMSPPAALLRVEDEVLAVLTESRPYCRKDALTAEKELLALRDALVDRIRVLTSEACQAEGFVKARLLGEAAILNNLVKPHL